MLAGLELVGVQQALLQECEEVLRGSLVVHVRSCDHVVDPQLLKMILARLVAHVGGSIEGNACSLTPLRRFLREDASKATEEEHHHLSVCVLPTETQVDVAFVVAADDERHTSLQLLTGLGWYLSSHLPVS